MSFLQQVQIALHGLPVTLVCLSDGTIVLVRMHGPSVYSLSDTGVSAFILPECISLWRNGEDAVEFEYQLIYDYKEHKLLKQWLQELTLRNPFTGEF